MPMKPFCLQKKNQELFVNFFDLIEIIPATIQSMKKSAEIRLELEKNGEIISQNDIFIAGIVLLYGDAFYTKNTKHFEKIKDMTVKTY